MVYLTRTGASPAPAHAPLPQHRSAPPPTPPSRHSRPLHHHASHSAAAHASEARAKSALTHPPRPGTVRARPTLSARFLGFFNALANLLALFFSSMFTASEQKSSGVIKKPPPKPAAKPSGRPVSGMDRVAGLDHSADCGAGG